MPIGDLLKFQIGVDNFLKFALANASDKSSICCPCMKCCNNDEFSIRVIKDHIYFNGISVEYKQWKWHGEPTMNNDRVAESEKVDFHPDLGKVGDENNGIEEREDEEISIDLNEFLKFVEDGDKPLWPGNTKTTKMNATIELFNLKAKHGMSDHCYSDMLMMIAMFLPEDNVEDLETLPSNLPLPLEDLCKWADSELKNERTINTTLGPEFLGHSRKVAVSRKVIYNMAHKQELSSDVLVCYMSYLHGELQKSEMLDMVAFVDPDFTGALGCGNPTDRAKFLSNRYKQGKPSQIFLVPHNNSKNWMLTVVIPSDDMVYLMDPFKRVAYDDEWKTVVNHSLKMFCAPKNKKSSRKEPKWAKLPGIPQQKDHNTCGYYIMCFMKEIVEDKDLGYAIKWGTKDSIRQYNTDDIDAVRAEWAKYVSGIP